VPRGVRPRAATQEHTTPVVYCPIETCFLNDRGVCRSPDITLLPVRDADEQPDAPDRWLICDTREDE